jgi:hypothetical protein
LAICTKRRYTIQITEKSAKNICGKEDLARVICLLAFFSAMDNEIELSQQKA